MGVPISEAPAEGWIMSGMKNANALQRQNMENQYYPKMAQAEIASKNAFAQNANLQNLATVLSNPAFYTSASKEQVNALLNKYAELSANPPSVESLAGGPPNNRGILSMIMNKFGGEQSGGQRQGQQPANAMNAPAPQQQAPQQGGPQQGEPQQPMQPVQPMQSPMQPPQASGIPAAGGSSTPGMPSTMVERMAAGQGAGDTKFGGVNPMSISTAQAAGLNAMATGEAGSIIAQREKMDISDNKKADEAVNQIAQLDKATQLRSETKNWQRGPIGGMTPKFALGSPAVELDTTIKNIVASVKNQQADGNSTDMGTKLATDSKADRSMPDAAFRHLIEYGKGMNQRIIEKPSFNQALATLGYTPNQVNTMWRYYQTKRPFYDASHHAVDENNLNTWEEFYSNPKRLKAAFSPIAAKEMDKFMGEPKSGPDKSAAQSAEVKQPAQSAQETGETISLVGGLKVPASFDSQQHFQEWYSAQPKATGGGGGRRREGKQ